MEGWSLTSVKTLKTVQMNAADWFQEICICLLLRLKSFREKHRFVVGPLQHLRKIPHTSLLHEQAGGPILETEPPEASQFQNTRLQKGCTRPLPGCLTPCQPDAAQLHMCFCVGGAQRWDDLRYRGYYDCAPSLRGLNKWPSVKLGRRYRTNHQPKRPNWGD